MTNDKDKEMSLSFICYPDHAVIQDDRGRDVIRINFEKTKIAIIRYPDYTEEMKEYLVGFYADMTDGDLVKFREFIDFKGDIDEFCA